MPIPTITANGRLTADPELRFTNAGKAYATLTIATNDRYKDATGEWKDSDATFMRGTIWGPLAEAVAAELRKGAEVLAVGRLKQSNYETQTGEKRSSLELDIQKIGHAIRTPKAESTTDTWAAAQPGSGFLSEEPF